MTGSVRLTGRKLNRATLVRQMLVGRVPVETVEGVRRAVALQAQEPASPYIALWNRVEGFDPGDLHDAFIHRKVVKASLMRITLHAVAADEYPVFHSAMTTTLRASRLNDRRFASTGLSVEAADELAAHVVQFASEPRTGAEIEAMLQERLGRPPERGVWWAIRTFAPLIHAPAGGPWGFGPRNVYVASPAGGDDPDAVRSVQRLIWRYLEGFGPASLQDIGQFAMLRQSSLRPALEALEGELAVLEGPDGKPLYDVPDAPVPDGDLPVPPRLMAMWDSVLLAYADRTRVIPEPYRSAVIRRNGDVLPTVLVDGHVSGVWRPADGGVEITAFHELDAETWAFLEIEARALAEFLADRDPDVYSRHLRWWKDLPAADVRRVG